MSHYDKWVRNQRLLRSAAISARDIAELNDILEGSSLTLMEGLTELGVPTGYLEEAHIQAITESLSVERDPSTGTWE